MFTTCSFVSEFDDLKRNLSSRIRSERVTISRDSSNEQNAFVWFQRLRLSQTQSVSPHSLGVMLMVNSMEGPALYAHLKSKNLGLA